MAGVAPCPGSPAPQLRRVVREREEKRHDIMRIERRMGLSPAQRGSMSGQTCPDVFELADGRYLVIGAVSDMDDLAAVLAHHGGGIGPGEVAVTLPSNCMRAAALDIAAEELEST